MIGIIVILIVELLWLASRSASHGVSRVILCLRDLSSRLTYRRLSSSENSVCVLSRSIHPLWILPLH